MKRYKRHSAPFGFRILKFLGLSLLLLFLSTSTFAQNTKGDKPVKNDRQIRETRQKSVRKKSRRSTRDIANRRLRTKNKSSANRANASYRQPSPYANRGRLHTDRSAKARGRIFSKSPRETRTRPWRGDVSGYQLRRLRPSKNEAARNNVYPQKGPLFNHLKKRSKVVEHERISTNTKGRRVGQQRPRKNAEHAWTGGIDKGPIKNQSATGSVRNIYPQKGPYVKYYRKHKDEHDKPVSNRRELSRVRRLSRTPRTSAGLGGGGTPSYSRPFIQRGKKNVYWGKFSKKERPYTRDITGGPLRTRNFRTTPPGFVGTDTVKFFGKKPLGDRSSRTPRGGYVSGTKGGRPWKGDVAGWRLRKYNKNRRREVAGEFVFPRKLSITESGERRGAPGGGYKSRTRRGEKQSLESVSSLRLERNLSGRAKGIRRPKGGGSISGQRRNNRGEPIQGRAPGIGAIGIGNFKGFSQQRSGFSLQGHGYSGNMKQGGRGFSRNGANYSGNIRRSDVRGFNIDGVNYSGKIKRSKVQGFSQNGVDYSGRIKRSQMRGFSKDGADYSGNIPRYTIEGFSENGVNYSGKLKRSQIRGMSPQGIGYSGRLRRGTTTTGYGEQGAGYAGNIKYRRPEKGGGSVSGKLWNNDGKAIAVRPPRTTGGTEFGGNIKTRRPEKGGGSVSGKLWNNDGKPVQVRTPRSGNATEDYSGQIALSRFRKHFVQNPNASEESLKKHKPDANTFRVSGLMIKVREGNYKKKPNADKNSLPGVAPSRSTVKASEYAKGMKQYWHYKHNPNSYSLALNGIAPGKASARINDYQGNVKMHKYTGSKLHPDAQFAHGYRDNVKEERTLLMNVKLMWAKLFRKSDNQPSNVKEKVRRPRYDKREKGLWYD